MTPDASASSFLATAVDAVKRAGAIQLAALGGTFHVRKKGLVDLVTEVDLAAERMIRALIAERHPDHDVLAEELGGPTGAQRSRYCWIVDPLDGTTNFTHGLPLFCCTVALEVDGRLEVGAIYDPTRDELFTAERGKGAYVNGARMHVSSAATLIDALLVTGFPYAVQEKMPELIGLFAAFLAEARAVRRLGSAALDVCYVAAGRMDGFWEQGLNAWDIAAGVLMIEEAGGRVTGLDGGPFTLRTGRIIATNGLIHDEMVRVIRQFYDAPR